MNYVERCTNAGSPASTSRPSPNDEAIERGARAERRRCQSSVVVPSTNELAETGATAYIVSPADNVMPTQELPAFV